MYILNAPESCLWIPASRFLRIPYFSRIRSEFPQYFGTTVQLTALCSVFRFLGIYACSSARICGMFSEHMYFETWAHVQGCYNNLMAELFQMS